MDNSPHDEPRSDQEDNAGFENQTPAQGGVILNFPSLNQRGRSVTNDLNGTNNPGTLKQNEIKPLTMQTEKDKGKQKTKMDDLYSNYIAIGEKAKIFYICFLVGIILALIVLGLSVPLFVYEAKVIAATTVAFSLFAIIACAFSIYIVHKNRILINEVVGLKDDPEKITQSRERMLLYTCCYCLMIIFIFFLFIGSSTVVYQSDIKMRIRGIGYDVDKWKDNFGRDSFEDVISKVSVLLNALSAFCFLFCFYILAVLIALLVMIKSYRTWKLMIQFVCMIFFQISFIFIHYGTNGIKFKNATLIEESMPGWVTYGLFGIGIVGLFIGLFAFFITFIEHKKLLMAYSVISVIMCIVLILLNVGGTMINSNFKGYLDAECNSLFSYIDEKYLKKELYCDNKYLFTTTDLTAIECPKYRVVIAWEYEEKKTEGNKVNTYGCINQRCCMTTYSFIKEKYDYLILMSYLLMLISMLFIFCSWYLIRNLKKYYDEGIRDNFIYYFILALFIVTALIMIPFLATIPQAPLSSHLSDMVLGHPRYQEALATSESIIPVTEEVFRPLHDAVQAQTVEAVIADNQYSVSFKKSVARAKKDFTVELFNIKLQCSNAYFMENPQNRFDESIKMISNKTIEDKKQELNELILQGKVDLLNKYLRYVIVMPYCEVSAVKVLLSITGIVKEITNPSLIANGNGDNANVENKNNLVIDLSDNALKEDDEVEVLPERELNFSRVDLTESFTLKGEVYRKINSTVSVYPVINPNCSAYLPTSFKISDGTFTIGPLYEHKSKLPLLYNITLTSNMPNSKDYPYINSIIIGGMNKIAGKTDLGVIYYATEGDTIKNSSIQGIAIDSFNNLPLHKIEVQIYDDYLYFNPSETNTGKKDFRQSTRTKPKGDFAFQELETGQYTVLFMSQEFYLETIHIDLNENQFTDLGNIGLTRMKELGELSYVLTWPNGPVDLDLYGSFQMDSDRNQFCTVSFSNYNCVEMRIDAMNNLGGRLGVESISMKQMGRHHYMFYVHKYNDKSNNIAKGEKKIEGLDIIPAINISTIPDTPLSQSLATIKVYGPGYRTPIIRLQLLNDTSFDDSFTYWLAFCIDGSIGISSYKIVNRLLKEEPDKNFCKDLYNNPS